MFSIGDALVLAIVVFLLLWILRRVWPEIFMTELEVLTRIADHYRKERRKKHTPDEEKLWPKGPHTGEEPLIVDPQATRMQSVEPAHAGMDKLDAERTYVKPIHQNPKQTILNQPSVGRAHLEDDGPFAGRLKNEAGGDGSKFS